MREALSLDSLYIFSLVVNMHSFAGVAKMLGTKPSTISRRISRLQRDMGIRLVRVEHRSCVITEDGLRIYEWCAVLPAIMDGVHKDVAETRARNPRAKVVVSRIATETMLATVGDVRRVLKEELNKIKLSTESGHEERREQRAQEAK